MNTKILWRGMLIAALALGGCSQNGGGSSRTARVNYTSRPDYFKTRRMITGSNIPQPVDRPTFSPTSANVPLDSYSRDRPGLNPTEPVVGADGESLYRLNEPSTGAGPAGSNPIPGD